jgi:hypothetical protein
MKTEQKRKTRYIPNQLKELIDQVNLLPLKVVLPRPGNEMRFDYAMADLCQSKTKLSYEEAHFKCVFEIRLKLWEIVCEFPETRDLIWEGKAPNRSPENEIFEDGFDSALHGIETHRAALRYTAYFELRENFKSLISIAETILLPKELAKNIQKERKLRVPQTTIEGNFSNYFFQSNSIDCEISRNGKTKFSVNGLFQVINDIDDFDITLIRSCKKCRKVFYAGRKDQSCCPPVKGKSSTCKLSYNVGKNSFEGKVERRENKIKEWIKDFKGAELKIHNPTPFILNSSSQTDENLILKKNTKVTITNLDFDKSKEDLPFQFFIKIKKDKTSFITGLIEIKCNARTDNYIEKIFGIKM